jgi:hypothetical protein
MLRMAWLIFAAQVGYLHAQNYPRNHYQPSFAAPTNLHG